MDDLGIIFSIVPRNCDQLIGTTNKFRVRKTATWSPGTYVCYFSADAYLRMFFHPLHQFKFFRMPQTFNGIGSLYYGKKLFNDDDSFVTTKWFVIGFFPLVPLASLRVRYLESRGIPFLARTASYEVLEELPIDWVQVLCTYAYTVFIIFWVTKIASGEMNAFAKFVLIALGIALPFAVRGFSKLLRS